MSTKTHAESDKHMPNIRSYYLSDGSQRFEARYYPIDLTTGRRRQCSKTCKTEREARLFLRKFEADKSKGMGTAPTKYTLGEYLHHWLETNSNRLSPKTCEGYRRSDKYITNALGGIKLDRLTSIEIEKFYSNLSGRYNGTAHNGRRTIEQCATRLNQVLEDARRKGLIGTNPCERANRPPHAEARDVETWTPEQAMAFLSQSEKCSYGPVWLVALATGMRRGEVLGLRWQDVDWNNNLLKVRKTVVALGGKAYIQDRPKTKNALRDVDVPDRVMAALKSHQCRQMEKRQALGSAWHDHDLIFAAANGNPINPRNLARDKGRFEKMAGVPHARIHSIRHLHCTYLAESGVDMGAISKRVGHARTSITMDLYSHVTLKMRSAVVKKVEAFFPTDDPQ